MSIKHLDTKVVVRRVGVGADPFTWEISESNVAAPRYVSPDRFRSMEAAYIAGRARLNEFLPVKCPKREKPTRQSLVRAITEDDDCQSDEYASTEKDQIHFDALSVEN
jgi:hypothetical protein